MRSFNFLRSHFLAGLFVVIPIGVIAWIVLASLNILWQVHLLLPDAWQPENLVGNPFLANVLNFILTLGLSVLLALCLSLLGWASKQFLGRKVLEWIGEVIEKIPVIRSIYSALDQFLKTLASGGGKQFNRVVYIEFPRKGVWTLAFVTSSTRIPTSTARYLSVYVPTTPNPTSGFYLIVPEDEVHDANIKVEEAFKRILSLGIAQVSDPTSLKRD